MWPCHNPSSRDRSRPSLVLRRQTSSASLDFIWGRKAPFAASSSAYHALAALPKHETRRKKGAPMNETKVSETRLREEICRLGRSLFERGLTPGSSGNISVKLDDGAWLVTPTNASLGFLDPARLSRLAADGRLLSGDAPTKEVPLHSALYQTREAARAVVHLHSTH